MNSKYIASCLLLPMVVGPFVALSSCDPKERANLISKNRNTPVGHQKAISCENLAGKELLLANQEVTISGYLFTHEEGPWLVSDPTRPLVNALTLKISDVSKLIPMDKSQPRWWYEHQNGYPVLVSGVIRVGEYETSIRKVERNHPYLEVSLAQEVDTSNPEWADSQSTINVSPDGVGDGKNCTTGSVLNLW